MRARLFVITSLAFAAIVGATGVAHAQPKGPGGIDSKPTATTVPPKGPDQYAPKPTTTTQPPKGPGDIAPKPPKGDDPKPNGPGDLANPQSDPVVDPAPTGNGNGSGSDLDYGTTVGDDEGPGDSDNGNGNGAVVEQIPAANTSSDNAATPATDEAHASSNFPLVMVVLVAGLVATLLALFATRSRRDDQDAERA